MRYRTHQTRVHNGRTPNVRSMLLWKTDLELCGINNAYNVARGERNAQLQSVHDLRGCIIHFGSSSTAVANAKGAANAHAWTRRPRWAWPVPLLFSTLRRHPEATQEMHDDSSRHPDLTCPSPRTCPWGRHKSCAWREKLRVTSCQYTHSAQIITG